LIGRLPVYIGFFLFFSVPLVPLHSGAVFPFTFVWPAGTFKVFSRPLFPLLKFSPPLVYIPPSVETILSFCVERVPSEKSLSKEGIFPFTLSLAFFAFSFIRWIPHESLRIFFSFFRYSLNLTVSAPPFLYTSFYISCPPLLRRSYLRARPGVPNPLPSFFFDYAFCFSASSRPPPTLLLLWRPHSCLPDMCYPPPLLVGNPPPFFPFFPLVFKPGYAVCSYPGPVTACSYFAPVEMAPGPLPLEAPPCDRRSGLIPCTSIFFFPRLF